MVDINHDLYPTRTRQPVPAFGRPDAIVHGTAGQGPLSAEQLEQYEQNGFLFFNGWLDAATAETLRAELHRLSDNCIAHGSDGVITEPGSEEVRSVFAVHRRSDEFNRLCRHPRLLDMARQILGSDVYVHQSRINYKPGFRGNGFNWHSDFETWHAEDGLPYMRTVSMSIILTDNHAFNGPLMLIPGSHRTFFPCTGETPDDHYRASLRQQELGVPDEHNLAWVIRKYGIRTPTGPAGSLLVFDCNTLHGSTANMSPDPRSNVFFVYNSVNNTPRKPYGARQPRPAFLGEREDFSPLTDRSTAIRRSPETPVQH
ncbi:MAG: ectoine hydroxylase [Aquisalimonadaceae bacterium]